MDVELDNIDGVGEEPRPRTGARAWCRVTEWHSMEDVGAIAGSDVDVAVVPAVVRAMIPRYDERVLHDDVAYVSE